MAVAGLVLTLYPSAASWVTQYNQSAWIREQRDDFPLEDTELSGQLERANEYNHSLTSGALIGANSHVPEGTGQSSDPSLLYSEQLRSGSSDIMSRVVIPSIDVDLPIYRGTDDATLLRGAGHLEGTHLPVGGESTHSAITAHRGLAHARMFTDLDKVGVGDSFSLVTLGETYSYQIIETRVVEPHESDALRTVEGRDLVTLVTCTPLGINSHRILVTGERITPTPEGDLERSGDPFLPSYPWWALVFGGGVLVIGGYVLRSGYVDPRRKRPARPNMRAETGERRGE